MKGRNGYRAKVTVKPYLSMWGRRQAWVEQSAPLWEPLPQALVGREAPLWRSLPLCEAKVALRSAHDEAVQKRRKFKQNP